jgi:hypothetical protein
MTVMAGIVSCCYFVKGVLYEYFEARRVFGLDADSGFDFGGFDGRACRYAFDVVGKFS